MSDAAVKAQWSDYHGMLLLKPTRLHRLSCPSAHSAVLPGSGQAMAWRFAEPDHDADDRNQEGTDEHPLHKIPPPYL